jgi:uncharacterized protein (DUF433 family)
MEYRFLARDPHSHYRQLRIRGRRIFARAIYGQHVNDEEPRSIEELARDFNLPVEAVREAIAYCQSNPPEIDEDFRMDEALAKAAGMDDPSYRFHPQPRQLSPEEYARIRDGGRS